MSAITADIRLLEPGAYDAWVAATPELRGELFSLGHRMWERRGEVMLYGALEDARRQVETARTAADEERARLRAAADEERARLRGDMADDAEAWSRRLVDVSGEAGARAAHVARLERELSDARERYERDVLVEREQAMREREQAKRDLADAKREQVAASEAREREQVAASEARERERLAASEARERDRLAASEARERERLAASELEANARMKSAIDAARARLDEEKARAEEDVRAVKARLFRAEAERDALASQLRAAAAAGEAECEASKAALRAARAELAAESEGAHVRMRRQLEFDAAAAKAAVEGERDRAAAERDRLAKENDRLSSSISFSLAAGSAGDKGRVGEAAARSALASLFPGSVFVDKSAITGSGDLWWRPPFVVVPGGARDGASDVLVEVKNYAGDLPVKELHKFHRDVASNRSSLCGAMLVCYRTPSVPGRQGKICFSVTDDGLPVLTVCEAERYLDAALAAFVPFLSSCVARRDASLSDDDARRKLSDLLAGVLASAEATIKSSETAERAARIAKERATESHAEVQKALVTQRATVDGLRNAMASS